MTTAELWVCAVHEAGHAVVACLVAPGTLHEVTLRPGPVRGGTTVTYERGSIHTVADIHRRLVVTLAGRAAEEVVVGVPSSGAGGGPESDLAVATCLAMVAATEMGLDSGMGLVWTGASNPLTLRTDLNGNSALAASVHAALNWAYGDSLALATDSRPALKVVASALEERFALDGEEVASLVRRHHGEG